MLAYGIIKREKIAGRNKWVFYPQTYEGVDMLGYLIDDAAQLPYSPTVNRKGFTNEVYGGVCEYSTAHEKARYIPIERIQDWEKFVGNNTKKGG